MREAARLPGGPALARTAPPLAAIALLLLDLASFGQAARPAAAGAGPSASRPVALERPAVEGTALEPDPAPPAGSAPPATGRTGTRSGVQGPSWLERVRTAAFARARRPLDDPALDAAQLELRRADLGRLPSLRLTEAGTVGWDGSVGLALDGALSLALWAPDVTADRRLTALRLALTERQLAAQRRSELHDTLARASELALAIRQLHHLDVLAAALARDAAGPSGRATSATVGAALRRTRIETALRVAGRRALARQALGLRDELQSTLAVELPELVRRPASGAGDVVASRSEPGDADGVRSADPAAAPGLRASAEPRGTQGASPLPFGAADLDPVRCLAGSDAVALARLQRLERRAGAALREARSATHVSLELGGGIELGSADLDASAGSLAATPGLLPSARARLALAVRLPPWQPVSGAAAVSAGSSGVEQRLSFGWPNREPAARPDPRAGEDVLADTRRRVRVQLSELAAQEAELGRRAGLLARALALAGGPALADAALRADLALELASVDHALALTQLDAALLCGALPP